MKAETNFNPGDKIWTIIENKAINAVIDSAEINIRSDAITIGYWLKFQKDGESKFHKANEEHCYNTKPELLESL